MPSAIRVEEGTCAIAHRAPRALLPGDKIVAFASGGSVNREKIDEGVRLLSERGYQVVVPETIYENSTYYAGDRRHRQTAFEHALKDPDVRALWAVRGGSGSAQVAALLDLSSATKELPWLIGFSDVTSLHAVWGQRQMQSLHGADLQTLGSWAPRHVSELLDVVSAPSGVSQIFEGTPGQREPRGVAVGRLWGGNLTVLASLVGTPFLGAPEKDSILFLEDVGEAPYRIDRALTQLAQSGAFQYVRGVAFGTISNINSEQLPYTVFDLIEATLAPFGLPWIHHLPIGHNPESRPLLLGVQATLDARTGTLVVGA